MPTSLKYEYFQYSMSGHKVEQFVDDCEICTLLNGTRIGTFKYTWQEANEFLAQLEEVLKHPVKIELALKYGKSPGSERSVYGVNHLISGDFREEIGPTMNEAGARWQFERFVKMFENPAQDY